MFAYLSLLVEQRHFDEIRVNFLIVGHTHAPIDQYFSVITKKLFGKFVGSPESLRNLFNQCQDPLINSQIFVQYDSIDVSDDESEDNTNTYKIRETTKEPTEIESVETPSCVTIDQLNIISAYTIKEKRDR